MMKKSLDSIAREFTRIFNRRSGGGSKVGAWYNTLFGKVLIPVIGFMVLSMMVTGLVFNYGINATSQNILGDEVRSDNRKVISSLQGRLETGNAAAAVLANNEDIRNALTAGTTDSLATINSRALVVRDRFELDLVQIYAANGEPRTNLVQSSLYKVSSVTGLLPRTGTGIFTVDGRLVYLARAEIGGGGIVIIGIDLESELHRIAFQLGLHDTLLLEPMELPRESQKIADGKYILNTPFQSGAQSLVLIQTRQISQFERVSNSGRNLILLGTATTTLFLIGMMALVLRSIVLPVRTLAAAARQLALADFETMTPDMPLLAGIKAPFGIGANDEIGQLAESFAHMSRELEGLYHGLILDLRDANRKLGVAYDKLRESNQQLSRTYDDLRASNRHLGAAYDDLQEANKQLGLAYDSALQGWSSALELRDHDTQKHTERVTADVVSLARSMGVPEEELINYQRGALLHDVGKMAIPDSILRKAGHLSEEEWKTMRLHPMYAFVMLRKIPFLHKALDIPYRHHEKWDGSGYPHGLFRQQIPLSARIFSVVDTWDALNNDRPYRKAWPREKALDYISMQAGKEFDPDVVKAFLEWLEANRIQSVNWLVKEKV